MQTALQRLAFSESEGRYSKGSQITFCELYVIHVVSELSPAASY
ncbi:unnamed protein product [Periconia digitata]|uniref:Uncharacterized protein n=1 Tax=Periconia digitata TaxID=1303443 RepID=A0A9W4UPQ5_9PLEO|nr:unnamed protein product [Periconia digitata]